ncbi:hypothetical protein J007_02513 [Cryptococcus neoformans]|nr:hypothetical protein J007_02513 [Cryptococcus neoformans var. grubii]OXC62018.1 hypothetical protein C358_02571 [Cryptococcus neoformans var. grubii MW-RSA852]
MDFSNVGIESHRHYPPEHSQAGHHEKEHKLGRNDVRLLHCSNKRSLPTAIAPMPTVFTAIPVDILSFHLVRNW